MSRVLVTGANGFTGRYLVPRLANDGHEVHGLIHENADDAPHGMAGLYKCDLDKRESLTDIVADVRPDKLVHLAAISFVAHGNVEEIYRTNVIGTRNLLQAIVDTGVQPSMVLVISSANIYGNKHEGVINEDVTPDPINDYAVSKLAMEYVANLYNEQLPIAIARPFNYTGVGQSTAFVIPKIVEHARKQIPKISLGNLDVYRDFSDVRTVVDTYAKLSMYEEAAGQVFNVCSGRTYSLRAVIESVQQLSGHRFTVEIDPAFVRANEVRRLYGNRDRLERAIGPLQMPPLEETLRWMLKA